MDESELPFEIALDELAVIVQSLERGQSTLDEGLASFARGIELLRHCRGKLEAAELRVHELVDVDENGRATLKKFDHKASAEKNKKASTKATRPRREKPVVEPMETDAEGGLFT